MKSVYFQHTDLLLTNRERRLFLLRILVFLGIPKSEFLWLCLICFQKSRIKAVLYEWRFLVISSNSWWVCICLILKNNSSFIFWWKERGLMFINLFFNRLDKTPTIMMAMILLIFLFSFKPFDCWFERSWSDMMVRFPSLFVILDWSF